MNSFRPPDDLVVHESEHWLINQRIKSALPGYLMVSSKVETTDLARMPSAAQSELGHHLACAQAILKRLFEPEHIYFGRYGHSLGYSIHFHVIPIYRWVVKALADDRRYDCLRTLDSPESDATPDGGEITLFVWREFCEGRNPPPIEGPSVSDVVTSIRKEWANQAEHSIPRGCRLSP